MTEQEARDIAKTAAREVAHEILTSLGIDTNDPFEMQRDFQHLRAWRESSEAVRRYGLVTLLGLFLTGVAGAVIAAFRAG